VRILVHDFSGHPFQIQLSRALAARGDDVLHAYCGDILTPKGPLARRPDDPVGFRVRDLGRGREFPKYQLGRRVINESRYARRFAASVREFRPDVVLLSNDPPVARLLAVQACRRVGVPVVLWLQDLYALALSLLFRQRLGPLASAPTIVANSLERRALRGCAAIVVIGKEFVAPVSRMVPAPTPVHCIENWAPLSDLPVRPKVNPLSCRLGLDRRFVFLYSGTLGLKHDTELLLELGAHVGAWPDTDLVVCSEGPGAQHVAAEARDRGLTTTRVIEYQPYERLPELLGAADVLVAMLGRNAALHSVPSKVMTYHAAARPILAAIAHTNSAAEFITAADSGWVVEPTDSVGWSEGAQRLHDDAALRSRLGAHARAAAEAHFDIDEIATRFRAVLATAARPEVVAR
jgi:glycosyltransferase involved in cell wall biosynthesis